MTVDVVYKFRTPLEGHLLSKPFMALSHEGLVHNPIVRASSNSSITLEDFSFFYAGHDVGLDDESASQRLFYVSTNGDILFSNLFSDSVDPPVAIGFYFPFSPYLDIEVSEASFQVLTQASLLLFNGLILGRLLFKNNKWVFLTDCVSLADKYFTDNNMDSLRLSLMPIRGFGIFSNSKFFLKSYNSVVNLLPLVLPRYPDNDFVPVELRSSGGVSISNPQEGFFYAIGYKSIVSEGDLDSNGVYFLTLSVLGFGSTLKDAIGACYDGEVFSVPMAVVKWSAFGSVITQFSNHGSPSSSSNSFSRFTSSTAADVSNKVVDGFPEPIKNSFIYVTFTKGNDKSNFTLNIRANGSGVQRTVLYKGVPISSVAGRYEPNETILFFFDGSCYEQMTSLAFQAPTKASDDGRVLVGGSSAGTYGDSIGFDAVPTAGSDQLVRSKDLKKYLDAMSVVLSDIRVTLNDEPGSKSLPSVGTASKLSDVLQEIYNNLRWSKTMFSFSSEIPDSVSPYEDSEGNVFIPEGSVVVVDEDPFIVPSEVKMVKASSNGIYWIAVDVSDDVLEFELVSNPGTWDPARRGCFLPDGRRTLKWVSLGDAKSIDTLGKDPIYSQSTKGSHDVQLPVGWYLVYITSGFGGLPSVPPNGSLAGAVVTPGVREVEDGVFVRDCNEKIFVFFNGGLDGKTFKILLKLGGSGTAGGMGGNGGYHSSGHTSGAGWGGSSGLGEGSSFGDFIIPDRSVPSGIERYNRVSEGGVIEIVNGAVNGAPGASNTFTLGSSGPYTSSYTLPGGAGGIAGVDGDKMPDGSDGGYCDIYQLGN